MRMIGIRRGLTALGRLPGQRRFVRQAVTETVATSSTSRADPESGYPQLAARIDRDIARRRRGHKGWIPYYYYHRALKQLDSLPAWCAVGYDFDCLLQKR